MAIETTTKEDTEMARTSKTAAIAEAQDDVVVELQRGIEERDPVEQTADAVQAAEPNQEADLSEQPELQPRRRGPALNRVELIGRIAASPNLRSTRTGMQLVYFRVATNGLQESDTEFHQCAAFGKTAQFIGQYLSTGRLVWLDGRLQTRSYDDPDGVRRWATTIIINRVQALDWRRAPDQDAD